MSKVEVTITRTIECVVEVEAESPEEAIQIVNRHSFELPPRDEWNGHKDWTYVVYDDEGEILAEEGL